MITMTSIILNRYPMLKRKIFNKKLFYIAIFATSISTIGFCTYYLTTPMKQVKPVTDEEFIASVLERSNQKKEFVNKRLQDYCFIIREKVYKAAQDGKDEVKIQITGPCGIRKWGDQDFNEYTAKKMVESDPNLQLSADVDVGDFGGSILVKF